MRNRRAVFVACLALAVAPFLGACGIQQGGLLGWSYYVGESPPPSDSPLWKPYRPRTRVPGMSRGKVYWLRTVLPDTTSGAVKLKDPALYFREIAEMLNARLDGRLLLTLGALDTTPDGTRVFRSEGSWPVVRLPADYRGGELLLRAVEPWDQREGILGGVYLGEHRDLQTRFIVGDMDLLVLGFLFLLFGLFALIVGFVRRDYSAALAFGLVGIFAAIQAVAFSEITLYMLPDVFVVAVRGFIFPMLIGSLLFFVDRILGPGPFKLLRYMWIIMYAYGVFLLITVSTPGFWFPMVAFPLLVVLFYHIVARIIKGNREARIILGGLLLYSLTALNDVLLSLRVLADSTYIMHWGILCLILALAITLVRRFGANEQRLLEYSRELEVLNRAYERFVPAEFLDQLGKENITAVELGDQVEKTMTILFSDIRSFTSLSESMSPSDTFAFINDFLERMGPVIRRRGGFIDKYIGDAIMALFPGAPDDALLAAGDMLAELEKMNQARAERGATAIDIGVGIHMGSLMLGTIGEAERMEGTVISDSVNLASRLEGLTKKFEPKVLISEATRAALKHPEQFRLNYLGEGRVKGKQEIIRVHGLENP